jgi:hypothetical protein
MIVGAEALIYGGDIDNGELLSLKQLAYRGYRDITDA